MQSCYIYTQACYSRELNKITCNSLQSCGGLFWSSGSVPLVQHKAVTQAETIQ